MANVPPYASLSYKPTAPRCKPPEAIKPPDWMIVAKGFIWMVETLVWKHDDTGLNVGNYSPELTEAMRQIESLKQWSKQKEIRTDVKDS